MRNQEIATHVTGRARVGLLLGALAGCGDGAAEEDTRPLRMDAGFIETPFDAGTPPIRSDSGGGFIRVEANDVPGLGIDSPKALPDDVPAAVDVALPNCAPLRPLNPLGETTSGTLSGPSLVPTACNATVGGALPAAGPEDVYSLTLTTARRVTLRTSDTTVDTVVSIRRACDSLTSELACNRTAPTPADGVSLLRARLDPGTYHVVVDQFGPRPLVLGGPYTLSLITAPVAANLACAAATSLASGAPVDGQVGSATESTPCGGESGLYLYYGISIPVGQRATVVVTPETGGIVQTFLMNGCTDVVCRIVQHSRSPGDAVTHIIDNHTGAPITRRIAVTGPGESSRFSVTTTVAPVGAAPYACASPTPFTEAAQHNQVPFSLGSPPAITTCLPGIAGTAEKALYYRADVPAGHSFSVTADPRASENVYIRLFSACGTAGCLAATNQGGAAAREGLTYTNSGTASVPLVVEIGNADDAAGSVDIFAQVAPTPRNGTCNPAIAPVVLAPNGATLINQNSLLAPESTSCLDGTTAHQLYYQFTAAPRTQNTIVVSPVGGESVLLGAQVACGQTSCQVACDEPGCVPAPARVNVIAGTPNPLVLNNRSLDAVVYTIVARGTRTYGIYARSTALAQPYTQTTVPTACVDLRSAAVAPSVRTLPGLDADDALSTTARLPFVFTLAGDVRGYFQVSSNGFMGLFASAADALPDSYYDHGYLPATTLPNGVIAPFWGDLVASTAEGSVASVRTGVSGTAPNRVFVVEWKDRAFYDYDATGVRLTFQAQLFETTSNLEFHYCSIVATPALNGAATGGAATIGVENGDGRAGVLIARDQSGAVSTARAFRLSPRAR